MKRPVHLFPLLLFFSMSMARNTDNPITASKPSTLVPTSTDTADRLRIKAGSNTFTATLLDQAAVTAFRKQLPLTLSMNELNGNEKYAQLPNSLPMSASNPGTIQAGDLMLYGSSTLVVFYETFQTSYSYTKLGRIDNPARLAAALGPGNITVSFEIQY
ncbi:cyclophilin-like fold protein [Fibrella arboris]|uniref:cyclophilin-like fold protein n=1 Tax=Fibrella arboris TaxID=3242486 RepID=UPI0035229AD5